MWPRVAAVSVLAVLMVSGCAGVRHRLLGTGLPGTPVDLPADAEPLGHFLRGQVALANNDVPTAVAEFERAIAADPSTPWLRLRLAQLYLRQGKLDQSLERAQEAARLTALSMLATIEAELGSLDGIKQIVKVFGMVNCAPGFNQTPAVIDGCSDVLVAIFGEAGRHTRSAVGMAELPFDIAVEIEMIVELAPA